MEFSWSSTIFTLIAAAIVILFLSGIVMLIVFLINSQKRKAHIEEKLDRLLDQKLSNKE